MTDIKEAQELEVVGYLLAKGRALSIWPANKDTDEPLCSLPKAQAIIDQQAARIALYERALLVSWPEGAKGEVCDLWNEARTMGSKGDV